MSSSPTSPHRRAHLSAILLFCLAAAPLRAQQPSAPGSVAQLLAQGSAALQHGQLLAAQTAFEQAVSAAPQQAEAYFGLGLVTLRQGKVSEAAHALQQATDLNPTLGGAHLFLGIAQYQLGQTEASLKDLRAELDLHPDNPEALTWLGIVALNSGHPEEAAVALDHAASLQPRDPQVLYYDARAHAQVAEAMLKKLYQLDPDSALVHRALAEDLAGSGQPEKSIAEYEKALAKQPGSADLLEGMADQEQRLSRFDDATRAYQQELTLNPGSAVALYNLGKIDVEHGKAAEGIPLLRKARALQDHPAPADFYLGFGLAELGQNEEAARWLEESLANQPSSFIEQSAYFQLARVYQRLGRHADAEQAINKLKELKAQSAPADAVSSPGAPAHP